jgi:isopenicillin N synthase-like dioxygenase
MIPIIDIAALFGPPSASRDTADRALRRAATEAGFMIVTELPKDAALTPAMRRDLLRIFALPEAETRKLWRQKFAPANTNIYRGWFPRHDGVATYKEGIDMGPDLVHGAAAVEAGDPLCEATPLPSDALLPGWRETAAGYYRAMERVAAALMQSLARGLGLDERCFDAAFAGGISTLRLIRYPVRSDASFAGAEADEIWTMHRSARRYVTGRAHVDSGFVTLLAQDGVEGLQARLPDGSWGDVPPLEGTLAVNFGKVLERWADGAIKATEHRVLGAGRERFSIPFFYEPRVDAEIAPLPLSGAEPFAPFLYGDHLWSLMTRFVEFKGLEHLRPPRRAVG